MMAPDKFPCPAWYVNDMGLQEMTLTGWAGRQKLWFDGVFKARPTMIHAGRVFPTAEGAIDSAVTSARTDRMRLKVLLSASEQRLKALRTLQTEILQKNTPKV